MSQSTSDAPKPKLMRKSQSSPSFDLHPADVRIAMSDRALARGSAPIGVRDDRGTPGTPREQPPAIISWKGLVVGLRSINKILLNGISGQITTGYWAIMG